MAKVFLGMRGLGETISCGVVEWRAIGGSLWIGFNCSRLCLSPCVPTYVSRGVIRWKALRGRVRKSNIIQPLRGQWSFTFGRNPGAVSGSMLCS